jgi:hypothetical protein
MKDNYYIRLIDKKIAKDLIIKNHYSHTWTSCKYALGLFNKNDQDTFFDEPIGVAIYGYPIGRLVVKSITSKLENIDVLELTRLWIHDKEPKNTASFFLGRTFKWLRENTEIKVLISYSDPMYNHIGIIYQATNWLYQGNNTKLVKSYMYKINNKWLHSRTITTKYGSLKTDILEKIDPKFERKLMPKKHRYLYILNKKDRKDIIKELKHPILSYPKNNDNCEW